MRVCWATEARSQRSFGKSRSIGLGGSLFGVHLAHRFFVSSSTLVGYDLVGSDVLIQQEKISCYAEMVS